MLVNHKNIFVIIVTFNGSRWIKKCVDSIRNSSIKVRIIVIDNYSTDNTIKLLKDYEKEIMIIELTNNVGFGAANNIGIKEALRHGAEYVFLLNQDAYVSNNTIETLVNEAEKFPNYAILSPLHLNGEGNAFDKSFLKYISNNIESSFIYDIIFKKDKMQSIYEFKFINAAAWLVSKDIFTSIGFFDKAFFHYGEDDNFCQRLNYQRKKIGVVPAVNIFHDRNDRIVSKTVRYILNRHRSRILLMCGDINRGTLKVLYRFLREIISQLTKFIFNLLSLRYKLAYLTILKSIITVSLIPEIFYIRKRGKILFNNKNL